MERKVKLVCRVMGLLGVLSAALSFVAEAIRFADSWVVKNGNCEYFPSYVPAILGLIALLSLLISQIVFSVSTACICCIKNPKFPRSNWGVAIICCILSWFTFFIGVIHFLNGVLFGNFSCNFWQIGIFAGGGIIALANSAFGIVYYLTLTTTRKNDGNIGSKPTLEGITMGQAQVPEVNEDPIFVHEDTYNRRQFP